MTLDLAIKGSMCALPPMLWALPQPQPTLGPEVRGLIALPTGTSLQKDSRVLRLQDSFCHQTTCLSSPNGSRAQGFGDEVKVKINFILVGSPWEGMLGA